MGGLTPGRQSDGTPAVGCSLLDHNRMVSGPGSARKSRPRVIWRFDLPLLSLALTSLHVDSCPFPASLMPGALQHVLQAATGNSDYSDQVPPGGTPDVQGLNDRHGLR